MYRILIIEDDRKSSAVVADYLEQYGYKTFEIADFRQVEQEFLLVQPHLVLMDVTLPYQNGFHLTRMLRRHSAVPILFLSARAGETEQVLGMESGGDDYITKPYNLEVLLAKVKAMLRRAHGEYAQEQRPARAMARTGDLELDLPAGEMRFGGQTQVLTRTEVRLLHLLLERAGQIVGRNDCLEALWDDATFVDDNTLTVNVTRLRAKLDAWGLREAIETRRGEGYILQPERLGARS